MAALKQEYEPQEWHQHLVPALDALIGNPDILTPDEGTEKKANVLYLPRYYVDRVNMFLGEQSNRGESAKILLGSFSHILGKIHYSGGIDYVCKNGMTIKFMPEENANEYSSGGRIGASAHALDVAKRVQADHGNEVAILTGDDYMASSAFINGLDVAHINPDVYTGRRKLVLPEDLYGPWFDERLKERKHEITEEQFAEYFPNEPPLKLNEFVEFEVEYATASAYGFHPNCFTWLIGRFETVRGGEHCCSIGFAQLNTFQGDEAAAILGNVQVVQVPLALDGVYKEHVSQPVALSQQAVVLLPLVAAHAPHLRCGIFFVGIGVGSANLGLLSVAADIESFQLDEHSLPDGKGSVESTLSDADGYGTGVVLKVQRVIDVATLVVARDDALDLHGLFHLLQRVVVNLVAEERLQLGNGLQVGRLYILVAVGFYSGLWVVRSTPF